MWLCKFWRLGAAINKKHQSGNLYIVFDVGRRTNGVNAALVHNSFIEKNRLLFACGCSWFVFNELFALFQTFFDSRS